MSAAAAQRRPAPRSLQLKVLSDPANVRTVRVAIERFCASLGFDPQACGDVGLCVNEAVANVIRHAYDDARDKPIEVRAECSDGNELVVTIRDWGAAVDAAALPAAADAKSDPLTPGGLGLVCMRQLMDDVRYIPYPDGGGGTLLRMTRRRVGGGGHRNQRT